MPACRKSTPRSALWLAVWLTFTGVAVAVSLSPWSSGYVGRAPRGPSDVLLYRAEIERMQGGATYYEAAAAELPARGYPTRSLFNWRLPLPMWLLARLPDPRIGKALLIVAACAVGWIGVRTLRDECGIGAAIAGGAALFGALLACALGELYLMPELGAGVLLALSVLWAERRPRASIAAGLGSLAQRELALPYVVLSLAAAAWRRRWSEAGMWLAGLALYGVWLAWHAAQIAPHISDNAVAHEGGWIRFGGAAFVVSLAQMNAWLLRPPQAVAALYLAVALWGAARWNTPTGRRAALTLAMYVAAFAIVGQDFNQYWGWMIAPLVALTFGAGLPDLLRTMNELARAARPALKGWAVPTAAATAAADR